MVCVLILSHLWLFLFASRTKTAGVGNASNRSNKYIILPNFPAISGNSQKLPARIHKGNKSFSYLLYNDTLDSTLRRQKYKDEGIERVGREATKKNRVFW
ncbi:hypothetical protein BDV09DRAFT_46645 [Aspergillus tetrazonus]